MNTAAIGPRTRTALAALGFDAARRDDHWTGNPWWDLRLNDASTGSGHWSEDHAWGEALTHLRANAEALCSRMMTAIASDYGEVLSCTIAWEKDGQAPHDIVLENFLSYCCGVDAR